MEKLSEEDIGYIPVPSRAAAKCLNDMRDKINELVDEINKWKTPGS